MSTYGQRVELTRYSVDATDRVLYGQRIDGAVHVFDIPADEHSDERVYLVERGLESQAALDALVADYLEQSERFGIPAMAASVIDVPASV
jgi:hypothetical protein